MATYSSTPLGQIKLQINALQQKVRRREEKILSCQASIRSLEEEEQVKGLNHSKSSKLNRQRFELKQAQDDLLNLRNEVEELIEVRNEKKKEKEGEDEADVYLEGDQEEGRTREPVKPVEVEELQEEELQEEEAAKEQGLPGVSEAYMQQLGLNCESIDNQELNFENY